MGAVQAFANTSPHLDSNPLHPTPGAAGAPCHGAQPGAEWARCRPLQPPHLTSTPIPYPQPQVQQGLHDMGHSQALDAVQAFEAKHRDLLARFSQMEADYAEEASDLMVQLMQASQQVCAPSCVLCACCRAALGLRGGV